MKPSILVKTTKLTPSLSLSLSFLNDFLVSANFLKGQFETLLPEFEPYFYKKGDPIVPFEVLKFSEKHKRCIKIYEFLRNSVTFGRVITYGEVAKKLGLSPRLVGYCMKINPFPVIIPCHRVLSQKGLGGYSAGLEVKKELLKHEGVL